MRFYVNDSIFSYTVANFLKLSSNIAVFNENQKNWKNVFLPYFSDFLYILCFIIFWYSHNFELYRIEIFQLLKSYIGWTFTIMLFSSLKMNYFHYEIVDSGPEISISVSMATSKSFELFHLFSLCGISTCHNMIK